MVDIEELDRDLYMSWFTNKDITDKNQIWNSIKDNNEILKEAIEVERNKWDTANTLKGIVVAHFILANFASVDREIYDSLVHIIYNDVDIARIVVDGAANGGFSFLLLTLMNPELKLTEKQKEFAINEAMNKVGTVKCEKRQEEYLKKLESIGITDDMNGEVDIKGIGKISIGAKTKQEYFNSLIISLDNTQAHGVGCFDIRYHILKNDNWSYDEKKVLVMDFWADQEDYDRSLEEWEWSIINDIVDYDEDIYFSKDDIYEITLDDLQKVIDNDAAKEMISEISFCRQMHEIRPMTWEMDDKPKKMQKKTTD